MPRRHTSSAAGALAAAFLAAVCAPASAQDAGDPPLRGSILTQQGSDGLGSPATPDQADASVDADTIFPNDLSDDTSLTPSASLGGLGDEPGVPVGAVPQFGITTVTGESGLQPPGTEDPLRPRALPPQRHDLDPYVPIGMKIGSFFLFTEAEIGLILTDNVLGTPRNAQSDTAFDFAPNVRLQSNWGRHFFSAEFDADRSWFKDFSVEDAKNYLASLRGRIDVTRRTHLELELGKSQTDGGRNSINLTDVAGLQTTIYEEHLTAAVDHTFNRLTLRLEGTVAEYDYNDFNNPRFGLAIPTVPSIIPQQDIRDFREDELRLRGTYEFKPRMAVFVEGEISEETYRQPVSVDGVTRDSTGFAIQSGMIFGLTNEFTGEIALGWGEQTSLDKTAAPIEGFLINADLIWQPTPMTMVEFLARSEVNTATLVDSLGAIDYFYELSLQHAFWRYLVLGGYVSYEIADYAENPLVEERFKEGASAEYYFNQYMSVFARYEHTDFVSTDRFINFKENEVRIGMRIRH